MQTSVPLLSPKRGRFVKGSTRQMARRPTFARRISLTKSHFHLERDIKWRDERTDDIGRETRQSHLDVNCSLKNVKGDDVAIHLSLLGVPEATVGAVLPGDWPQDLEVNDRRLASGLHKPGNRVNYGT